jgi:phage-related protein
MIGNLSPEWVAHTNNKASKNDHMLKIDEEYKEMDMEAFKKSLSETINVLKNENSHFTSTSFDNVGDVEAISIEELIKNLLSTYSESIFGHFSLLVKEMNRKLNTY